MRFYRFATPLLAAIALLFSCKNIEDDWSVPPRRCGSLFPSSFIYDGFTYSWDEDVEGLYDVGSFSFLGYLIDEWDLGYWEEVDGDFHPVYILTDEGIYGGNVYASDGSRIPHRLSVYSITDSLDLCVDTDCRYWRYVRSE
ncbi:MAG: hypothetical protein J6328_04380 [Bacilli bacterium]|nr:hypothetical protein [Bacilli bacterium]